MADRRTERVIAWAAELLRVHAALRAALEVTRRTATEGDSSAGSGRDLLLFCRGFCSALTGHHHGEDATLFPAVAADHPDLAPVLELLQQDHRMIAHLVEELDAAAARGASPAELEGHLAGLSAIMENHFRFEERQLRVVLSGLDLRADPAEALGPL